MVWRYKKILAPEEVKKLSPDIEVHLEGRDRRGELVWLEGHVIQSGRKKVFVYQGPNFESLTKDIKAYKNKSWVVSGK